MALHLTGCQTTQQYQKYTYTKHQIVSKSIVPDSAILRIVQPYKIKIESELNIVIGSITNELKKELPDNTLGYLVAESIMHHTSRRNIACDFAIVNTGTLRIPNISFGPITKKTIFELLPFDNRIVTLQLTDSLVTLLLNHAANAGGWAVGGASYGIDTVNSIATNIKINGKNLEKNKIYTLAVSDYLAQGGDQLNFLKVLPSKDSGGLVRDAIIEYITMKSPITITKNQRVYYDTK